MYEQASKIDFNKTEVSFTENMEISRKNNILEVLRVREVHKHEKCLGLPTIIGRSKQTDLVHILKKLQGWKDKLLVRHDKETVIKPVARPISNSYLHDKFHIQGIVGQNSLCNCNFGGVLRVRSKNCIGAVGKSFARLRLLWEAWRSQNLS